MSKIFTNKFNFILPVILCVNLFAAQEVASESLVDNVGAVILDDSCKNVSCENVSCVKKESIFKIFPSKSGVQFKKEIIARDKELGKRIMYGVVGASSIVCSVLIYKFVKNFLFEEKIVKPKALSNYDLTRKILALEGKAGGAGFLSLGWFKSGAESLLASVLVSGLAGFITPVMSNFYKRYNCLDNVNDFFSNKAQSILNFESFLEDVKIFDAMMCPPKGKGASKCKVSDDEIKKLRFELIAKIRNMVDELEAMVAFMEYKIDSVDNVILTQEDVMLPNILFERANSYCKDLQLLFDGKLDSGLYNLSAEFINDFIGIINIFNGLECRLNWLNKAN
jgi:hypothetical protein